MRQTAALPPLALALERARTTRQPLQQADPALVPADATDAWRNQEALVALRGGCVGGWKVGARQPGGAAQGAPLPAGGLIASGGTLALDQPRLIGLELEIAFRFTRPFLPQAAPYPADEVLEGLGSMMATIELVSSRFAHADGLDPLLPLADLQNHGALVVGAAIPYQHHAEFCQPALVWQFDGCDILPARPGNPAGDPRTLLPWLVNHASVRGMTVTPDTVITTGTFTGVWLPTTPGTACGRIGDLPEVRVTLT